MASELALKPENHKWLKLEGLIPEVPHVSGVYCKTDIRSGFEVLSYKYNITLTNI